MPISHDTDIFHLQKLRLMLDLKDDKKKKCLEAIIPFTKTTQEEKEDLTGLTCCGSVFYSPSSVVSRIITFYLRTRGHKISLKRQVLDFKVICNKKRNTI